MSFLGETISGEFCAWALLSRNKKRVKKVLDNMFVIVQKKLKMVVGK
jgi:hypothetical protein